MPKVKFIKARKEYTCGKCGKKITTGEKYYRGSRNFCKHDTIRCSSCGLKAYELSTSEYTQRTGYLMDKWIEEYKDSPDILDDTIAELEDLKSSREENLENIPENLRETSSSGEILQEQIDNIDNALSDLEALDTPENDDLESEEWEQLRAEIEYALQNNL